MRRNLFLRPVWFWAVVTVPILALIVVAVKFSLAKSASISGTSAIQSLARSDAQPDYGTMGFDNTRFFSAPVGEDWMKIMATGRREFITEVNPRRTALVIVDVAGDGKAPKLARWDKNVADAFAARFRMKVVPNTARLLELFRKQDMVVIYTILGAGNAVNAAIAPSVDRMRRHREFVLVKFSAGAFATSAIDNILRENGIATLIVTGCDTAGCVLATIEGADDRTFQTILVEDACASLRQDYHEAVIKIWTAFGFVRSTDQVIDDYPWQSWVDPALREKKETTLPTPHFPNRS